jgi:hypothetical protein
MLQKNIAHPLVAVVYDGFTGQLRSKVIPSKGQNTAFWLQAGENFLVLNSPPYDDAACNNAILAAVGHVWADVAPGKAPDTIPVDTWRPHRVP